jgi:hypothetical protein
MSDKYILIKQLFDKDLSYWDYGEVKRRLVQNQARRMD